MAGKISKRNGYSDQVKRNVVKKYLEIGNLSEISRIYKIHYETIMRWKASPWWEELVKQIRDSQDMKLASKMEEVVEQAIDQIKERVEDGEKILDSKTGLVISVPVKTRDLTQAVKTLSDRTDVLIGRQKKEATTTASINDKLNLLAEQFAKFAGKQRKPLLIEGEFVEEN